MFQILQTRLWLLIIIINKPTSHRVLKEKRKISTVISSGTTDNFGNLSLPDLVTISILFPANFSSWSTWKIRVSEIRVFWIWGELESCGYFYHFYVFSLVFFLLFFLNFQSQVNFSLSMLDFFPKLTDTLK